MVHRRRVAALLGLFAIGSANNAAAQEGCDDPIPRGPIDITPAVSAGGVTLGAPVKVRYPEGYFEDPLIGADPFTSIEIALAGVPWPGAIQVIGDTLVYIPDPPFDPGVQYEGIARGVDFDLPFRFRTGSTFDLGPPVLGEITSLTSAPSGPTCDAPEGGYRIDVTFEAATDDGPPGDIEYSLFLTRGPLVDEPVLLGEPVRNIGTGTVVMAATVPAGEIAGPICVAIIAVDGVGELDDDAMPYCDDPVKGNFFAPLCSASAGVSAGPRHAIAYPWIVALLVVFLLRAKRRRAP